MSDAWTTAGKRGKGKFTQPHSAGQLAFLELCIDACSPRSWKSLPDKQALAFTRRAQFESYECAEKYNGRNPRQETRREVKTDSDDSAHKSSELEVSISTMPKQKAFKRPQKLLTEGSILYNVEQKDLHDDM